MMILPVIDVRHGIAVRGRGGKRDEYAPLKSSLVDSTDPLKVAQSLLTASRGRSLYLADLDAIEFHRPNHSLIQDLLAREIDLWLDAGVRDAVDVANWIEIGVPHIVLGLESLTGPEELLIIASNFPIERLVFSLDMKAGRLLANENWLSRFGRAGGVSPLIQSVAIAKFAMSLELAKLILLDLARVGMEAGTGAEELCRVILANHPHAKLYVGGGIRDRADIEALDRLGVAGVLVASALHDGRITSIS